MAFVQKMQIRLNREGGIYGNSRRHSQLLITRLRCRLAPRSHIKRIWISLQYWGCERAAENPYIMRSTISTCWFKKHIVNKEIWEPPFIIKRSKGTNLDYSIFILRSVFVYRRCAEQTLIRIKQVCCVTDFHFGKGLFYKQTDALAVLLKRKYCLNGWNFINNCAFDIQDLGSTFRIETN